VVRPDRSSPVIARLKAARSKLIGERRAVDGEHRLVPAAGGRIDEAGQRPARPAAPPFGERRTERRHRRCRPSPLASSPTEGLDRGPVVA
jgi:hypothetical protein